MTTVVTPNTNFLFSGSVDGTVRIWKKFPKGIEFAKHYYAHKSRVISLVSSYDGSFVASVGEDKSIKIYDVESIDHAAHHSAGVSAGSRRVGLQQSPSVAAAGGERRGLARDPRVRHQRVGDQVLLRLPQGSRHRPRLQRPRRLRRFARRIGSVSVLVAARRGESEEPSPVQVPVRDGPGLLQEEGAAAAVAVDERRRALAGRVCERLEGGCSRRFRRRCTSSRRRVESC